MTITGVPTPLPGSPSRAAWRCAATTACGISARPPGFSRFPIATRKSARLSTALPRLSGAIAALSTAGTWSTSRSSQKTDAPDGLRKAVFLEALGPGYLDLAYRLARETDPRARLVVNEYDIELDTPEHDARRVVLLDLLRRMQKAGTPVDAVGIQAHLTAVGGPPFSVRKSEAVSRRNRCTRTDNPDHRTRRDRRECAGRHRHPRPAGRRHLSPLSRRRARRAGGQDGRHLGSVRPAQLDRPARDQPVEMAQDGLPSRPLPFDADLGQNPPLPPSPKPSPTPRCAARATTRRGFTACTQSFS